MCPRYEGKPSRRHIDHRTSAHVAGRCGSWLRNLSGCCRADRGVLRVSMAGNVRDGRRGSGPARAGCDGESGQDTTRGPAAAFRGSRLRGARIRSITPRLHGVLCHGHCTPGGSARQGSARLAQDPSALAVQTVRRTGGRRPGCGRCDAADPACQDDRAALVGRDRGWCGTRGAGAGTRRVRA